MQAGLYIVGTPIGNLGDFSSRGIETLQSADIIACEDTRVSGKLAEKFDIKTKRIALHEHNEREIAENLIQKIESGMSVALISDSGMPGISDPGFRLVREARARNVKVFAVPGPTAFATAVVMSGFPTDKFSFFGFLPSKENEKIKDLRAAMRAPGTLIFYESPNRIMDTIKTLAVIAPERKICVARELTKMFEEVVIGYPADFPEFEARGEIVLLIEPAAKMALSDDEIKALVGEIVKSSKSTKDAAVTISEMSGISKSEAYEQVLKAKQ